MTKATAISQQHVGGFVLVRKDHQDFTRAGRDGQIMSVDEEGGTVGLYFGYDRNNVDQLAICVGVEEWDILDLDVASVVGCGTDVHA